MGGREKTGKVDCGLGTECGGVEAGHDGSEEPGYCSVGGHGNSVEADNGHGNGPVVGNRGWGGSDGSARKGDLSEGDHSEPVPDYWCVGGRGSWRVEGSGGWGAGRLYHHHHLGSS